MDRAAAELLSPDRAAAEGAALGQLACELPGGGLLITASRLVEFGARAAILLAPGLFRLDLTPREETLGLYPRAAVRLGGRVARGRGFLGRVSRPEGPGADRAARALRRPRRAAAGVDPRALVHGARRAGDALRGQVRDHMDVDALLTWYERVRRPLPWRATRDPYALLVSEVMLQQTQALRVVPYYERWLARFPTRRALAARRCATCWRRGAGSGYNRRALALQRAAAVVAERGWPADLTELPGVGPYTAAAVARSRGIGRSRPSTRTCGACCRAATASTTRRARWRRGRRAAPARGGPRRSTRR